MRLFQYWDTGAPPDEVAGWIEGFRANNPELKHRLYDRASARSFIGEHFGERERRAFDACAVPAMQADVFRLCALVAKGGVYVDADFQSKSPLGELLKRAPRSLMLIWRWHIVTGLIMTRSPGDPLLRAALNLMLNNIEERCLESVYTCTGPGVFTAIRALLEPATLPDAMRGLDNPYGRTWDFPGLLETARRQVAVTPELEDAYQAMTLLHTLEVARWIGTEQPAYKRGEKHWLRWSGPIYA